MLSTQLYRELRGSQGKGFVTTGMMVFYYRFFACSNPHVNRCSKPLPWDPLSSPLSQRAPEATTGGDISARRLQRARSLAKQVHLSKYPRFFFGCAAVSGQVVQVLAKCETVSAHAKCFPCKVHAKVASWTMCRFIIIIIIIVIIDNCQIH